MVSKLKPECEQKVSAVLGRPLTYTESQELVACVKSYYLRNRESHPGMSMEQVVSEAAKQYAKQIENEAKRKALNAKRQAFAIYQNYEDKWGQRKPSGPRHSQPRGQI